MLALLQHYITFIVLRTNHFHIRHEATSYQQHGLANTETESKHIKRKINVLTDDETFFFTVSSLPFVLGFSSLELVYSAFICSQTCGSLNIDRLVKHEN